MADELIATFDEWTPKPEVGSLVDHGVGKSFCAGGDVATPTSAGKDPVAPDAYEGMGKIYDSSYRWGQVRVPMVAAVRGSAVGAWMNMLQAADLRIVAKDARLLTGFPKRGMHPGGEHFAVLSRLIGREAAVAMALFGRRSTVKRPSSSAWRGNLWTTPRSRTGRSGWPSGWLLTRSSRG
jgi:enoyl-CoA hydratase/carnithine racemase